MLSYSKALGQVSTDAILFSECNTSTQTFGLVKFMYVYWIIYLIFESTWTSFQKYNRHVLILAYSILEKSPSQDYSVNSLYICICMSIHTYVNVYVETYLIFVHVVGSLKRFCTGVIKVKFYII